MSEDELLTEIEQLNKRMFKMKAGPMQQQMLQMVNEATQAYAEKQMIKRLKKDDEVLEIGTIQSETIEANYDETELLNIIVQSYTSENKK